MKSKRKILFSVILALISIVFYFGLTACGTDADADKTLTKLTNDVGFVVDGGGFAEGSVLEASVIDSESEDYKQAITLIASESYDKTKTVYVFEISVKKDNVKVQPNGKVKVSVPISEDLSGYDVLHVKDDEKIERLTVTYGNGIATFETECFSKFIFVAKETVSPVPDTPAEPDSPNPNTKDTAEAGSQAEWDKAINYWKAQINVKVVEIFANQLADGSSNSSGGHLYQLENNAYSYDGIFVGEAEGYKGKALYIVKDSDTYYAVEWSSGKGEDDGEWIKNTLYTKSDYDAALERNIYNCIDFYAQPLDLSYSKFTYDATNTIYKNADNTINVAFTFESGTLTKIVVTVFFNDSGTIRTSTRTITFGDAVVEVPTVE